LRRARRNATLVAVDRPDQDDFPAWVERLADPLRAQQAYWHLVLSGPQALPAVRAGLDHPNADVRVHCTRALDHLVDDEAFPKLVTMLDDPDPRVRREALHAIACDRCKDNACRPTKAMILSPAIDLLLNDENAHVRAFAAEVVGRFVHADELAAQALERAAAHDEKPAVRKKASWYAPGGTIFDKTR
jgi:hypothetical protein